MNKPVFNSTISCFRHLGRRVSDNSNPLLLQDFMEAFEACNTFSMHDPGTMFIPAVAEIEVATYNIAEYDNRVNMIKLVLTTIARETRVHFDISYDKDGYAIGVDNHFRSIPGRESQSIITKYFSGQDFSGQGKFDVVNFESYVVACWQLRQYLLNGLDALCLLIDIDIVALKNELGILEKWRRDWSMLNAYGLNMQRMVCKANVDLTPVPHAVIALYYYYSKLPLNDNNAGDVAAKYGHTATGSGKVLIRSYTENINGNSININKNTAKNLRAVLLMLNDLEAVSNAERDLAKVIKK